MRSTVAWAGAEPDIGMEFVDVSMGERGLSATGVAVRAHEGAPYRVDYQLEALDGFVTTDLRVTVTGVGWRRRLDLRRADGGWRIKTTQEGSADLPEPGGPVEALAAAVDCDLGLSPLTNTLPIRRAHLLESTDPVDFQMAWVDVPTLAVHASPQRYTPLGPLGDGLHQVRFSSLDSEFTAVLTVDAAGLLVDYPGLASAYPGQEVRVRA